MEIIPVFMSSIERELGMCPTFLASKETYMILRSLNKNQKWVPLRAMKTFIRKKMGHTT